MIRAQRRAHRLWWFAAVLGLVGLAVLGLRARRPPPVQDRLPTAVPSRADAAPGPASGGAAASGARS